MRVKRHLSHDYFFLAALTLSASATILLTHKNAATAEDTRYDRAQTIIVNLNKMPGCAGWYLLQDIKQCQLMDHDLGKAHHQLEEADRTYGKLRGRPDDKFLVPVMVKLDKAIQSRALLEQDLHDTFDQLRETIKDIMLTDEARRKTRGH